MVTIDRYYQLNLSRKKQEMKICNYQHDQSKNNIEENISNAKNSARSTINKFVYVVSHLVPSLV